MTAPTPSTTTSPPDRSSAPTRPPAPRSRPAPTVDYVVSLGVEPTPTPEPTPAHPAPVAVPDVRGFAAEDAVNQLLDAGLEPGDRTEAFDDDVAAGCGHQHRSRRRRRGRARHDRRLRRVARCRATPIRAVPDRLARRSPPRTPSTSCSTPGSSRVSAPTPSTTRSPPAAVISTDPAAGAEVAPGTDRRLRRVAGRRADADPRADPEPTPHRSRSPTSAGSPPRTPSTRSSTPVSSPVSAPTPSTTRSRPDRSSAPTRRPARRSRPARPSTTSSRWASSRSRSPTSAAFAAEDAVNQLLDAGLEPGERTDAFDNDVAAGAVVSTDPAAGTQVAPGTTVDYVVSLGVEPTPTPDQPRADPCTRRRTRCPRIHA